MYAEIDPQENHPDATSRWIHPNQEQEDHNGLQWGVFGGVSAPWIDVDIRPQVSIHDVVRA